jgi:hypothetical protein
MDGRMGVATADLGEMARCAQIAIASKAGDASAMVDAMAGHEGTHSIIHASEGPSLPAEDGAVATRSCSGMRDTGYDVRDSPLLAIVVRHLCQSSNMEAQMPCAEYSPLLPSLHSNRPGWAGCRR